MSKLYAKRLEHRQLSEQRKSPRGWQEEYKFQEMLPCSQPRIKRIVLNVTIMYACLGHNARREEAATYEVLHGTLEVRAGLAGVDNRRHGARRTRNGIVVALQC